jgi:hypothetical protein
MRTEVFRKERHADHVDAKGNNLRDDHIDVPMVNVSTTELEVIKKRNVVTDHVVISNATMISSLRMSAVNEIATMFKNSFSNRTSDMIIIVAPKRINNPFVMFGVKQAYLGRD